LQQQSSAERSEALCSMVLAAPSEARRALLASSAKRCEIMAALALDDDAGPEGPVPTRHAILQAAQAKLTRFTEVIGMKPKDYAAPFPQTYKILELHQVLGVAKDAITRMKNATTRIARLRVIFDTHLWLCSDGSEVIKHLLVSEVYCTWRYIHGARAGVFSTIKSSLDKHAVSPGHMARAKSAKKRQIYIVTIFRRHAAAAHGRPAVAAVAACTYPLLRWRLWLRPRSLQPHPCLPPLLPCCLPQL